MAWVYLAIAGLFEIVWAISLKYADGFTRLWPSAIAIIGMQHYEVTVKFDKPVNVSKFSWPIERQRVTATVGIDGVSLAHTSDGEPHMRVRRE